MKTALIRFCVAMLATLGIVACSSQESMSAEEVDRWIAAYTPERIDTDAD